MEEKVLKIRALFSSAVSGFGLMHAKVCNSLMSGDIKTAKQLSQETLISHNKIYSVLKDLVREKVISCTRTDPASYCMGNALKSFQKIIEKKVNSLQRLPMELQEIIQEIPESELEREYVIRFDGKQTKLFDNKNKSLVKEAQEAKQLMQQLNDYIKAIEPKRDSKWSAYRF